MAQEGVNPEGAQGVTSDLGPESQGSSITKSEVIWLQEHFHIPDEYELSVPGPNDRVVRPPDGRVAIYQESLWCGFRFPISEFFLSLLRLYRLVPAQLSPNSVRVILAFAVHCHNHGVRPRASLFRAFFVLRKNPKAPGWFLFSARPKRSLLTGFPSSIHGWKGKFFFLGSHLDWGFNTTWREPYFASGRNDSVDHTDMKDFTTLRNSPIGKTTVLLIEPSLYAAGLSRFAYLGDRPPADATVEAGRLSSSFRLVCRFLLRTNPPFSLPLVSRNEAASGRCPAGGDRGQNEEEDGRGRTFDGPATKEGEGIGAGSCRGAGVG